MVFSSVSFLVFFLPCLLVLYFMVPRRYRGARNFILLAFSLAFFFHALFVQCGLIYLCSRFAAGAIPANLTCRELTALLAGAVMKIR